MFATAIRVAAALAKNGSILPPLDYRRGSKSKAGAAELAGRASSNEVRHPDVKGRTLSMSDRFSGKVSPFAVRALPAVASGLLFGQKS
ncbi:hypothetical protein [Agrobacterium rosae]|uniref:hypothetical protein n=1 Tax=Agrobacterium rosae TaxID=1972867 RepID=UPI000CD83C50|nr:hypothetical protein [Agrobacterium rosae]POO55601.1 hypothetical protein CTT39_11680 [Agrobacterium rosae]